MKNLTLYQFPVNEEATTHSLALSHHEIEFISNFMIHEIYNNTLAKHSLFSAIYTYK